MSEKKAKYTQPPWTIKPSEDMIGHYVLAEFAEKQRRVYHRGNPDGINIKDLIAEEKANAVLMEAAPKLLAACEWALANMAGSSGDHQRLQDAIATAKGGQR